MIGQKYTHEVVIRERYIDSFGHLNHAVYLQLFEEARWEWVTRNGFGLEKMMAQGQGPIVVDVHVRYKREIRVREHIKIESGCVGFKKRLAIIQQSMLNEAGQVCCVAEVTLALFDKTTRQMIAPTPQFLCSIGLEEAVKSLDSGVHKIDSNIIF